MQSNTLPWYKQFWPWFLIAIPVSSFIVGFIVIKLSVDTSDSLVVDDYYKEGKAINMNIDRLEMARTLGIQARLLINESQVALMFDAGAPQSGEALRLAFRHTTLKDKDFTLLLTRDATGTYRASSEQALVGKWRVTLEPMDESWRIHQVIALPRQQQIAFNPQ